MTKTTKSPWTVLLLIPDYAAGETTADTYQCWVRATTAQRAADLAKQQACSVHDDVGCPEDYHCLAVYAGHISIEHSDQ